MPISIESIKNIRLFEEEEEEQSANSVLKKIKRGVKLSSEPVNHKKRNNLDRRTRQIPHTFPFDSAQCKIQLLEIVGNHGSRFVRKTYGECTDLKKGNSLNVDSIEKAEELKNFITRYQLQLEATMIALPQLLEVDSTIDPQTGSYLTSIVQEYINGVNLMDVYLTALRKKDIDAALTIFFAFLSFIKKITDFQPSENTRPLFDYTPANTDCVNDSWIAIDAKPQNIIVAYDRQADLLRMYHVDIMYPHNRNPRGQSSFVDFFGVEEKDPGWKNIPTRFGSKCGLYCRAFLEFSSIFSECYLRERLLTYLQMAITKFLAENETPKLSDLIISELQSGCPTYRNSAGRFESMRYARLFDLLQNN